jgi:DNA-directed RNA polymerase specialized sigma24 family protein
MNTGRRYKTNTGKYKMYNAMLELPEEDYEILYELYFKHTSVHQLSRSLGITCKAIRWRRARALKNLKEIVKKEMKS